MAQVIKHAPIYASAVNPGHAAADLKTIDVSRHSLDICSDVLLEAYFSATVFLIKFFSCCPAHTLLRACYVEFDS